MFDSPRSSISVVNMGYTRKRGIFCPCCPGRRRMPYPLRFPLPAPSVPVWYAGIRRGCARGPHVSVRIRKAGSGFPVFFPVPAPQERTASHAGLSQGIYGTFRPFFVREGPFLRGKRTAKEKPQVVYPRFPISGASHFRPHVICFR